MLIVLTIAIIGSLPRPKNPSNLLPFSRLIGLSLNILGIKFELEGKENLKQRPVVYVSNHQHNLDILPVGKMLPFRTVSVGKKVLSYIPFFGQFYWLTGNILIDRSNRKKAYGVMDAAVQALKNNDTSIWLMPEGTRNKGKGIKSFKRGAFYMAINAGVPIVPISYSDYFMFVNIKKWRAGKIKMKVHAPIDTSGYTNDNWQELAEKSRQVVIDGYNKVNDDLEKELGYNYKK